MPPPSRWRSASVRGGTAALGPLRRPLGAAARRLAAGRQQQRPRHRLHRLRRRRLPRVPGHRPRTRGPLLPPQPPELVEDLVEPLALDQLHGVEGKVALPPNPKTGTILVWCSRAAERASRAESLPTVRSLNT